MPPIELIEKRTRNGKVHLLETLLNGRQKFSFDGAIGAIHYKDNPKSEQWLDIDTTIVNGQVKKAPYDLDIYLTGMPGFHYKSKESGEFDVRLKSARSGKVGSKDLVPVIPKPKIEGNRVIWENIYPDTDVILEVQNTRVCLKRLLKSDKSPLEYDVDIQEIQKGVAQLLPLKPAEDAVRQFLVMEEKSITGGRTEKLKLEVIAEEGELPKPIVYPILDSTVVDEQVGAGLDDADERESTGAMATTGNYIRNGSHYYPCQCGYRFQTVNVPQGATIDTAYNSFCPYYGDSGSVSYTWYGEDIDDAPAFTTTAYNISGRTKTSASVNENPPANWLEGTWIDGPEIKTIIQEIVNRVGWAANQDMVNISDWISGTGERDARSHEYNSGSATKLHIEYTAGGAGTTVTPSTLSLILTEYAPLIIIGTILTPTTLSLIITEYAPILKEVVTPVTLSLTLTGYAPSINVGTIVTPTTASLTLTAYAPVIKETITPATVSLTSTGYTSILKEKVTPDKLSLAITAYASILKEVTTPSTLSLILTKYIPTISISGGTIITPTTASLVLTSYAPILKTSIVTGLLSLSLSMYAPSLMFGVVLAAYLGSRNMDARLGDRDFESYLGERNYKSLKRR